MPLRTGRFVLATVLPLVALPLLAIPVSAHAPARSAPSALSALSAPSTPSARAVDPDPDDRESMRLGWTEVLKPTLQRLPMSTANLTTCEPGAPSDTTQSDTLVALNYFRDLVGVEPVTFSADLSAKAQKAALIMAAQYDLSHAPPESWACWTAAGKAAAGKSNLYLGRSGAGAITGYMVDPGSGNTAAGHRRWIIDPRQTTMGSGSVFAPDDDFFIQSNALYVLDTASWQAVPASTSAYLPWPVAGYVPQQVEPNGRWSLSASDYDTDFSEATVKVDGSAAGITVHDVADGYGPPTLVWNFDAGFDPGDADREYDVVVSGIRRNGNAVPNHAYTVTLFDAEAGPQANTPPTVTRAGPVFKVVLAGFDATFSATDPDGVDAMQERIRERTSMSGFGAWQSEDWTDGAGVSRLWGGQDPGSTTCSTARARDADGMVSDWLTPATCRHTPLDDTTLSRSAGWTTTTDARLWLGSASTSKARGAKLTFPGAADLTRLGVVATACPTCGKLSLHVGTLRVGTIELDAPTTTRRSVVMLPALGQAVDGTVKLVVRSSGKKVQVDGLVVSDG